MRRHAAPKVLAAGVLTVLYTYVGYPLLLSFLGRRTPVRASRTSDLSPTLSVVVAALDEEAVIAQKIADLKAQEYDADLLEIIVVADGSQDSTPVIAADAGARVLFNRDRRGKSAAVNRGVAAATGELVCLTDANCFFAPGTLRALVEAFDDPSIALVSGSKQVYGAGARGGGEGLYWRMESYVRKYESRLGSTMSAPGEVLVVRRELVSPIPSGVINDDYHLLCDVLARGYRARYEHRAVAREEVSMTMADELERRSRIAAGTWQTTLAHLRLANPRRGFVALAFVSHRVLRNLVVPILLPALWVGSLFAGRRHAAARRFFVVQTCMYALAAAGAVRDERVFAVPFQFALVNVATLRGALRLLTRRQPVAWARAARTASAPTR